MPIRPENRHRYPKDWPKISLRIRRRAKWRCECKGECGTPHKYRRCPAQHGEPHPHTGAKVVLTVAHLNQQPEDCADTNLKAMCQRCHNRLDMPHRKRGIAERRRAKLAIRELF
jgi:hypothetical protein